MTYWWVNHKQTYKEELGRGYIWSPQRNKKGHSSQGYTNLTLVNAGDTIFSFADTFIKAVGVIEARYKEAGVPAEFGTRGNQWDKDGYMVKVVWTRLELPFQPKEHIEEIRDLLPPKYSPIQKNGRGNQGIYLSSISLDLGEKLIDLINDKNIVIAADVEESLDTAQEEAEQSKILDSSLPSREKEQLIKARIGQGIFRKNVNKIEPRCRVTKVTNLKFLIASHIKPWARSNNQEKLDGNNGFLLSPHIDKLFDNGWISFSDNGDILIAKSMPSNLIKDWGIEINNVGSFNKKQKVYLAYHREHKFKDHKL